MVDMADAIASLRNCLRRHAVMMTEIVSRRRSTRVERGVFSPATRSRAVTLRPFVPGTLSSPPIFATGTGARGDCPASLGRPLPIQKTDRSMMAEA